MVECMKSKLLKKYTNLEKVASYLNIMGYFFAGVDMMRDYITEINITSPLGYNKLVIDYPQK